MIISGVFSPIGRKVLMVMMGAATVGVSIGLRACVYVKESLEYEKVL